MSSTITGLRLAIAIIEFLGSTSSFIGASFIIVCYVLLPMRWHFRHILILNLAISDALNGLCDALSGMQILIHRVDLRPSFGCTINGLIGQLTVQGTDTSIFAITCVTVYTVTRRSVVDAKWSRHSIILTCVAIWILPFITSFTALAMHWYGPVSGNWCWLIQEPLYMRYALTHGWRFLFILLEIALYGYLHFYLERRFNKPRSIEAPTFETGTLDSSTIQAQPDIDHRLNNERMSFSNEVRDHGLYISYGHRPELQDSVAPHPLSQLQSPGTQIGTRSNITWAHIMAHRSGGSRRSHRDSGLNAVEKVLLLNAYPLLYVILWLPGLANRLVEATGNSSQLAQVLQCTTQFVGLANAFTFGWNEQVALRLKNRFRNT